MCLPGLRSLRSHNGLPLLGVMMAMAAWGDVAHVAAQQSCNATEGVCSLPLGGCIETTQSCCEAHGGLFYGGQTCPFVCPSQQGPTGSGPSDIGSWELLGQDGVAERRTGTLGRFSGGVARRNSVRSEVHAAVAGPPDILLHRSRPTIRNQNRIRS